MDINTPYATVSEATLTLGSVEPWKSASLNDKNKALQMGRAYIDSKYTCIIVDEINPPSPIKIANSELANLYLTSPSTFFGNSSKNGLTKSRVKAGSVELEKQYESTEVTSVDLYPHITAILQEDCTKLSGSSNYVTR